MMTTTRMTMSATRTIRIFLIMADLLRGYWTMCSGASHLTSSALRQSKFCSVSASQPCSSFRSRCALRNLAFVFRNPRLDEFLHQRSRQRFVCAKPDRAFRSLIGREFALMSSDRCCSREETTMLSKRSVGDQHSILILERRDLIADHFDRIGHD